MSDHAHPVDRLVEQYRSVVQAMVPDQLVLSVGIFTAARTVTADGSTSQWLVDDVALGLGTGHLIAVHYRPSVMAIEPLAVLATWNRDAITITYRDEAVVRLLYVDAAAANMIELRSERQLGAFDRVNDVFYRDLALPALSTPPGS